jgi:hypothetical protein
MSRRLVAHFAAGEFEEKIFEVGRTVHVAHAADVLARSAEQRLRIVGVAEYRFAADLDALTGCDRVLAPGFERSRRRSR